MRAIMKSNPTRERPNSRRVLFADISRVKHIVREADITDLMHYPVDHDNNFERHYVKIRGIERDILVSRDEWNQLAQSLGCQI